MSNIADEYEKRFGCYVVQYDNKKCEKIYSCQRKSYPHLLPCMSDEHNRCPVEFIQESLKETKRELEKRYRIVYYDIEIGVREHVCDHEKVCDNECSMTAEDIKKALVQYYESRAMAIRALGADTVVKEYMYLTEIRDDRNERVPGTLEELVKRIHDRNYDTSPSDQ